MTKKNRLYEVFSKVNNITLNENIYEDVDEANDDFTGDVTNEIKRDLSRNNRLFNEGVPSEITISSLEYDNFKLNLDTDVDVNGILFVRGVKDQLLYSSTYKGIANNNQMVVRIPFVVEVEKQHTGDKTVFYTKTWHDVNDIEVEVVQ